MKKDYLNQYDVSPISKSLILPNGFLHWVAPIARTTNKDEKGLLYFDKDGKPYYQKVTRQVLEKTIDSFKGIPSTFQHPKEFVTSKNALGVTRGLSSMGAGSSFVTDSHIWLCGTNFDEELIQAIRDKKAREISPGYHVALESTEDPEVKNQVDRIGNHIAFLPRGRNGSSVALNLDSDESELKDSTWDFCLDSKNFDKDYFDLINREIAYLPEDFLNFERVQKDSVDLTPHITPKKKMPKLQLLLGSNKIVTVESEQQDLDALSSHIASLETKSKTEETNALTAKTQVDSLTTDLEVEKAAKQKLQTDLDAATKQQDTDQSKGIKSEAAKLAVSMFKVLPNLLAVKPDYQVTEDSLDELGLMREFLIAVMPEKKDVFSAMNIDGSPESMENIGAIKALYNIKAEEQKAKQSTQQTDQKPYGTLTELQTLLNQSIAARQTDSNEIETRRKALVADIDKAF